MRVRRLTAPCGSAATCLIALCVAVPTVVTQTTSARPTAAQWLAPAAMWASELPECCDPCLITGWFLRGQCCRPHWRVAPQVRAGCQMPSSRSARPRRYRDIPMRRTRSGVLSRTAVFWCGAALTTCHSDPDRGRKLLESVSSRRLRARRSAETPSTIETRVMPRRRAGPCLIEQVSALAREALMANHATVSTA